jgi:hypothetical protein
MLTKKFGCLQTVRTKIYPQIRKVYNYFAQLEYNFVQSMAGKEFRIYELSCTVSGAGVPARITPALFLLLIVTVKKNCPPLLEGNFFKYFK